MNDQTKVIVVVVVLLLAWVYTARISGTNWNLSLAGGDPTKDSLAQAIKAAEVRAQAWGGK